MAKGYVTFLEGNIPLCHWKITKYRIYSMHMGQTQLWIWYHLSKLITFKFFVYERTFLPAKLRVHWMLVNVWMPLHAPEYFDFEFTGLLTCKKWIKSVKTPWDLSLVRWNANNAFWTIKDSWINKFLLAFN